MITHAMIALPPRWPPRLWPLSPAPPVRARRAEAVFVGHVDLAHVLGLAVPRAKEAELVKEAAVLRAELVGAAGGAAFDGGVVLVDDELRALLEHHPPAETDHQLANLLSLVLLHCGGGRG